MQELLPVLTAWVDDGPQLTSILLAASNGEVAFVPLEQPPFEQTTHALEVHVAGAESPFTLLAEPVGFATEGLFPLLLRPLDDEQAARLREALSVGESPERVSTLPPPASAEAVARAVSRPPPDPLAGRAIADGKFTIEQLLGTGGVGRVYRARHRDLQKTVAIKVLHEFYQSDPDYSGRFQGEAQLASRIDHPNVLRVLDFGQEPDGLLYIVMEYLEGRTLTSVLQDEGSLPLARFVSIAVQLCTALSVAHDAGIVHRDIKPDNVLLMPGVDDEGRPAEIAKICDFGIAQTRASEDPGEPRTIAGTPEYMSPEQWQALPLDPRTDVYSLGVTLYQMATCALPFTGRQVDEVFLAVLTRPVPPPSTVDPRIDPRLERIVLRCLEKDPAQRYASARDVRADLRSLVGAIDGAARLERRRELIDAAQLPPLEEASFTPFFVAFSTAVMRTGYYDRAHAEAATSLARLAASTDLVLQGRGELSFARRDVGEAVLLTVMTGAGEVKELKRLLPPAVYGLYAEKWGDIFSRRGLVSLVLRDGIDEGELSDLVEFLSGPEVAADVLREQFLTRGFSFVSALFASDLLGRKRKLPWQVDLCMSRLARDLQALPLIQGMGVEQMRVLRSQLAGDVVRTLTKPEHLRILLDNADLIAAAAGHLAELADVDVSDLIVGACAPRAAVGLGRYLLEMLESGGPAMGGSDVGVPAVRVDPRLHLQRIVARLTRDRSMDAGGDRARHAAAETDGLLRQLYDKSFLSLPDLPHDLRVGILGEERAEQLLAAPAEALAALDAVTDPEAYEHAVTVMEAAARALASRGHTPSVLAILQALRRHVADERRPAASRRRAALASRVLEDPAVLAHAARTLLGGAAGSRPSAQRLLAAAGAKAAAPLAQARVSLSGHDASARARFVATFRELGPAGLPALLAALEGFADDADPLIVEDFLRALPDVESPAGARLLQRFVSHPAPGVRRAAASALAPLGGPSARGALLALFAGEDDGARLGALAGLRRIKAIDPLAVARIDEVLAPGSGAGEEVRAAAAASLAEAVPEARAAAVALLVRLVRVQRKSFIGALKSAIAPPPESAMVLVTGARALLAIGGPKERVLVEERAAVSPAPLKEQLQAVLHAPAAAR